RKPASRRVGDQLQTDENVEEKIPSVFAPRGNTPAPKPFPLLLQYIGCLFLAVVTPPVGHTAPLDCLTHFSSAGGCACAADLTGHGSLIHSPRARASQFRVRRNLPELNTFISRVRAPNSGCGKAWPKRLQRSCPRWRRPAVSRRPQRRLKQGMLQWKFETAYSICVKVRRYIVVWGRPGSMFWRSTRRNIM
ncbi:hypothetical protein EJB05_47089, partial [Eragrostis curvula]